MPSRFEGGNLPAAFYRSLSPALRATIKVEILDGKLLKDVVLESNIVQPIAHSLGRDPRGWFPVRMRSVEISGSFTGTSDGSNGRLNFVTSVYVDIYPGDTVTLSGSTNYNGTYRVLDNIPAYRTLVVVGTYGASETGTFTSSPTPVIADRQDPNNTPSKTLDLVSNVDVTADIWIF